MLANKQLLELTGAPIVAVPSAPMLIIVALALDRPICIVLPAVKFVPVTVTVPPLTVTLVIVGAVVELPSPELVGARGMAVELDAPELVAADVPEPAEPVVPAEVVVVLLVPNVV